MTVAFDWLKLKQVYSERAAYLFCEYWYLVCRVDAVMLCVLLNVRHNKQLLIHKPDEI